MAKHFDKFFGAFKHFFRRRSIIIVSDESVEHIHLGARMQLLGLAAIIGLFSWISYSTGGYMAAQSTVQQKEQQLVSTVLKNKRIGEEYSLLKQDLLKLQDNKGELSDYAQFIIDQHDDNFDMDLAETFAVASTEMSGDDEALQERIEYLQQRIDELKESNTLLVDEVHRRTRGKIAELNEVIRLTGLNKMALQGHAKREIAALDAADKAAAKEGGQGGPFIPSAVARLNHPALFKDLDQLVMLQLIVEKLPLALPVPGNPKLTSGFGRRVDPFTGRWAMHSGQDFVGPFSGPVTSTSAGVVVFTGRSGAYGNMVEIDHGMGITTRYGHLSSISVRPGQKVTKGQTVGRQGSTGRSTGQHVHYEVRLNDRALNPRNFITAGNYVQKTAKKNRS